MSKLNYYELLEIYPAATQEDIDNAFRLMLYKYHPDHNPDRPDWAHEKTAEVVEAYNILADPLRRKIYNFMIMAVLKTNVAERKFSLFQGGQKKNFEQAMKYFKEGVSLYESSKSQSLVKFQQSFGVFKMAETVYNMGVIYTATNKLNEALRAFQEAVKNDSDNKHYLRVLDKFQELKREIERARR